MCGSRSKRPGLIGRLNYPQAAQASHLQVIELQLQLRPKAGHDLRDVSAPGEPWSFAKFASGHFDMVTSWVKDQSASPILPAPPVTH